MGPDTSSCVYLAHTDVVRTDANIWHRHIVKKFLFQTLMACLTAFICFSCNFGGVHWSISRTQTEGYCGFSLFHPLSLITERKGREWKFCRIIPKFKKNKFFGECVESRDSKVPRTSFISNDTDLKVVWIGWTRRGTERIRDEKMKLDMASRSMERGGRQT